MRTPRRTSATPHGPGYQAVAEYVDHYAPVRTRLDKATARAARVLTPTEPTRIKTRAWQLASAGV